MEQSQGHRTTSHTVWASSNIISTGTLPISRTPAAETGRYRGPSRRFLCADVTTLIHHPSPWTDWTIRTEQRSSPATSGYTKQSRIPADKLMATLISSYSIISSYAPASFFLANKIWWWYSNAVTLWNSEAILYTALFAHKEQQGRKQQKQQQTNINTADRHLRIWAQRWRWYHITWHATYGPLPKKVFSIF